MDEHQHISRSSPTEHNHDLREEVAGYQGFYMCPDAGGPRKGRLLGPIGYILPAEADEAFCANMNTLDMVA